MEKDALLLCVFAFLAGLALGYILSKKGMMTDITRDSEGRIISIIEKPFGAV